MKQHIIIIFSVKQLTRIKITLRLSYKKNIENIQDSFSKNIFQIFYPKQGLGG